MHNGWKTALLGIAGTLLIIFLSLFFSAQAQTQDRVFNHETRITTLEESKKNTDRSLDEIKLLLRELNLKIDALKEQSR